MSSDPVGSQWLRSVPSAQVTPISAPSLPPSWNSGGVYAEFDQVLEPALKRPRVETKKEALRGGFRSKSSLTWAHILNQPFHGWSQSGSRQDGQPKAKSSSGCHDNASSRPGSQRFPQRPNRPLAKPASSTLLSSATRKNVPLGNVQTKPYVAEPPPAAPRFKHGGPADFHRWNGHHSEDVLNESTTRNGLYEKPPPVQNESATARPAISSSLKHKSGLQILSSLLVAILDQRQVYGATTANCTFKPPPRVTLTDTKREAWLRDLADPDIPLRRLSRTIPHGIRGKVLLDHCLAKAIPTARAVWLAKCVGANEIRAFKRKGAGGAFAVGGEAKWIKDWTANVEQFVEAILSSCGGAGWRTRTDYGLRLASHLASEKLMDQDHYLNWVISSVQTSDLDNLLIWLLLAQMHQDELLQQRLHGRRLVQALLEQLQKTHDAAGEGTHNRLVRQLLDMLSSVLRSHPACFLLPQIWHQYEALLRRSLHDRASNISDSIDNISRRNKQLRSESAKREITPRQKVIQLLDTAFENFNITNLADACLALLDDIDTLVITCLQWGSSLYRFGDARVYLTARLLRKFGGSRNVLDKCITQFVATPAIHDGLSKPSLFRIFAELFRSKHLNAGKYLQWLMARGGALGTPAPDQHGPCDARLLFEMPTNGLPSPSLNLRSILLSRFGASVADEQRLIRSLQGSIANQVPGLFLLPDMGPELEAYAYDPEQLSIPIKSTVAQWIRENLAAQRSEELTESSNQNTCSRYVSAFTVTLDQFKTIRRVLEDLADFAILADVLKIMTGSEDVPLLTYVCDTVIHHLSTFAAIGALQDLFLSLLQQYEDVHDSTPAGQTLIESLIDLGKCVPNRTKEVRHLRVQMLLFRQQTAAPACSPISDHMTEALQSAESNFSDEIDQILANGTSMDKRNMTQLFGLIVKHSHLAWTGSKEPDMMSPVLLSRLRSVNPEVFDELTASWIDGVLRSPDRHDFPRILPPFIYGDCITLKRVLGIAREVLGDNTLAECHTAIAVNLVEVLAGSELNHFFSIASKAYRLRLQYIRILRQSPMLVIPFLLPAVEAYTTTNESLRKRAQALILSQGVKALVTRIAVCYPQALQSIGLSAGAAALVDKLIFPRGPQQTQDQTNGSQLRQLLAMVDDYNMPLCQLRLNILLANATADSENTASALSNVFGLGAGCNSSHSWPELVSGLLPGQGECIRHSLEREVLSRMSCRPDVRASDSAVVIDRMLSIIDAIGVSSSNATSFPLITQIAEKITSVLPLKQLPPNQSKSFLHGSSGEGFPSWKSAIPDLIVLLRLLVIHQPTIQHLRFPQSTLTTLLVSLSILFINPYLKAHSTLLSSTNDILLVLSDSLSDESRSRCVRKLAVHNIRDPRLHFVFGCSESVDCEWLQLVTNCATTSEARSAGNPIITRQTAQPYPLRRWEMMQDATPLIGTNDTSLSLTLFGTQKSTL